MFCGVDHEHTIPVSGRLCKQGVTEQLLKLTKHGELDVQVSGTMKTDGDGAEVLCVERRFSISPGSL